ncbi:MAG TPA: hypothetical protein VF755_20595, partial [Catenuloplanes sp.]
MSDILMRRYERLLNVYPADYRRARGTEVLETLREAAEPGRQRPARHEVVALILGALRVRAGSHGRRTTGQTWLAALRLGALSLLVLHAANTAAHFVVVEYEGYGGDYGWALLPRVGPPLGLAVGLALNGWAIVAVLRSRYRTAMVAAALTFAAAELMELVLHGPGSLGFWQLPLAVVLLIPLLRRPAVAVSKSVNYVLAVPFLFAALTLYSGLGGPHAIPLRIGALASVCVAACLWSVVDERVALTLGLLLLDRLLAQAVFSLR